MIFKERKCCFIFINVFMCLSVTGLKVKERFDWEGSSMPIAFAKQTPSFFLNNINAPQQYMLRGIYRKE